MTTHDAPVDHEAMFDAFINGRLGHDEWTHDAHLITCWVALRDRNPQEAIDFLRDAIKTHNCGIGVANTETEGYHETITVYYVHAIHRADTASPGELSDHEWCHKTAPLRYWDRDTLFSREARAEWVEPNLEPLPWPIDA